MKSIFHEIRDRWGAERSDIPVNYFPLSLRLEEKLHEPFEFRPRSND